MRRDILEKIREEFLSGAYVKEFKVGNHSYMLKLLNAEEEIWRDKHVPIGTNIAVVTARKLATLAISLQAIDGESVEVIFGDEGVVRDEDVMMDRLFGVDSNKKFVIAEMVLKFLGDLPSSIISYLYDNCYVVMEEERNKGLKGFLMGE